MQTDPRLLSDARSLSAGEFARRYPHPFLGVRIIEPDSEDERAFETLVHAIGDLEESDTTGLAWLVPVAKRAGANTFSFITIGRASNNDIVIARPLVSKSHALLQATDAGYTVSDMGSRNGTALNGQPLVPRQPRPIVDGDVLLFAAGITAEFLDAKSAQDWLPAAPV